MSLAQKRKPRYGWYGQSTDFCVGARVRYLEDSPGSLPNGTLGTITGQAQTNPLSWFVEWDNKPVFGVLSFYEFALEVVT